MTMLNEKIRLKNIHMYKKRTLRKRTTKEKDRQASQVKRGER